ncbi:MAG TPA: hypothetical protein VGJ84_20685, partial [Polyangiaceae bacterium]
RHFCSRLFPHRRLASIYREQVGVWKSWDEYYIIGNWKENACRVAVCQGGRQPDGASTPPDFPWSWVDPADTTRIRVLLAAYDAECSQVPLHVVVATDPF